MIRAVKLALSQEVANPMTKMVHGIGVSGRLAWIPSQ